MDTYEVTSSAFDEATVRLLVPELFKSYSGWQFVNATRIGDSLSVFWRRNWDNVWFQHEYRKSSTKVAAWSREPADYSIPLPEGCSVDTNALKTVRFGPPDLGIYISFEVQNPTTGVYENASKVSCEHEYVNVGFSSIRMVCRHCDRAQ